MPSATLQLTRELIRCESVTPADAGCLEIIGGRLADIGFELDYLPSGDVSNLWATFGAAEPRLVFAGHVDVVPSGDLALWDTPPFEPTLVDGYLCGRGAADMKGSLAAMVVAAEQFVRAEPRPRGSLAFLLTSDEEGPAVNGTIKVVERLQRQRTPMTWCVIGEPSSDEHLGDTLRVGRRGSLNGRLTVHGVQGHVAYPERADNPIVKALPALAELAAIEWDRGNEYYPPTTFQISNATAGTGAENVIPQNFSVWFNFRFCTETTAPDLQHRVERVFESHGLRFDLEWQVAGQPFLTRKGAFVETVAAVVERELGVRPTLSTGGGTSDGRFIAPVGVELVELGPVNATIHKINECVAVEDLDRLAAVYQQIMVALLGR